MAIFFEQPPPPAIRDAQYPLYVRRFRGPAASQAAAFEAVASEHDVRLGALYRDHQGQSHNPYLVCLRLSSEMLTPALVNGTGVHEVIAEFGYPQAIGRRGTQGALLQPTLWVEYETETGPMDVDVLGVKAMNTADEPFEPPPTLERTNTVMVAQWLELGQTLIDVQAKYHPFIDKVNNGLYVGWAKRCLKCRPVQIEKVGINTAGLGGANTFVVTVRLAGRPQFPNTLSTSEGNRKPGGWEIPIINRGYREKSTDNQENSIYRSITLPDGSQPARPVLLGFDGLALPPDSEPVYIVMQNHLGEAYFGNLIPNVS